MGGVTSAAVTSEVLLARAFLSRVAEPACVPLWDLVRTVGPVEAEARLRRGDVDDDLAHVAGQRVGRIDPAADLEVAERHGIRLVTPECSEWPHFAMSALERTGEQRVRSYREGDTRQAEYGEPVPPLALWVRGEQVDLPAIGIRSAGIVGSRAATAYGERVAADLAHGLARKGFAVVSGGAYGIDAAAHRGALGARGVTVIVSAGGLDAPYPPSNARLFAQAAEAGLLVSESPPGSAPRRRRFLTRNRLIAALSTGCVVVEASRRSGAVNTAGHCRRLGRPLMAVPGPVTSAMSVGCHDLLRSPQRDVELVTSVSDVIELIGTLSELSTPTESPAGKPAGDELTRLLDGIDEHARQVFDSFPARHPLSADEIIAAAGLPPGVVIPALSSLEVCGLVERCPEGLRLVHRRRCGGPRPGPSGT